MFAEIVPEQLRSAVYAFDRSFEGAVGATAAPLVGLVAEKVFGYAGSLGGGIAQDAALVLANARALGNSMLILLLVPWGLDFFFYCGKACSIRQLPLWSASFWCLGCKCMSLRREPSPGRMRWLRERAVCPLWQGRPMYIEHQCCRGLKAAL